MLGKSPNQKEFQLNLYVSPLQDIINPHHSLIALGKEINWDFLEESFKGYYSTMGAPSKPIRLMVGLLILKHLYNLSDERVVEAWVENPYYQYFTGGIYFSWEFPCAASDLVHFRHRIGEEGIKLIFEQSVELHKEAVEESKEVLIDTTVEEKNITYPTDTKLAAKVIKETRKYADEAGIKLRQSYRRVVEKLQKQLRYSHRKEQKKASRRILKRLRTIAGRLVREVSRKAEALGRIDFREKQSLYERVLAQKQDSKDKIYSLHEPQVACIAKGKAHKPYEFGCKIGIATLPKSNVIVGIAHFLGNPHDSQTLEATLQQAQALCGKTFQTAIVDRGYAGKRKVGETEIILPSPQKDKHLNTYQKRKKRKQCRSRSAVEPVIGHLKAEHRLKRNFLKGVLGDKINAWLAAAAFNVRKWLNRFLFCLQKIFTFCQIFASNLFQLKLKTTF
jgi:IS5 family transposase